MKHPQKLPWLIAICLLLNCLPGNVQAQVGNEQATQKVTDAWISVTSMAFPEVSVALEAGKQMLEMLGVFDKPDATAEAIKKINQRLDELGRRIKNVEKSVNELKNDFFKEKNWTRLQTLKTRRELLQNLAVQLKRPSDDKQVKRDLAKAVGSIADDFLDPELWNWSDMYQGQMKDPDFKPLPTLELYATTLVTWMTAIANTGDDSAFIKRTYGPALQTHINYLNDTLAKDIRARVFGAISGIDKWPKNRICTYEVYLADKFGYLTGYFSKDLGEGQVQMPSNNDMCQIPEAMANLPEVDRVRGIYGIDVMEAFSAKLDRLRARGTLSEDYVGEFDKTAYQQDFLYAVNASGELLWYRHMMATKPKATPPDMRKLTTPPQSPDMRKVNTEGAGSRVGPPTGSTGRLGRLAGTGDQGASSAPTQTGAGRILGRDDSTGTTAGAISGVDVIHRLDGPKILGSGWEQFRDVIPAGKDSLYALTEDGTLKWYRHDNLWDDSGMPQWKGPINVGRGWQNFVRVVPAGDGILYAIDANGNLKWYKHSGYLDGSISWSGPVDIFPSHRSRLGQIGSGPNWAEFKQVFSGGEGVIYAVTPDGVLHWYHHRGYLTGTTEWDGPKDVGTDWQDFTRVFSTGDGIIYAMKPTGEMVWYKHAGYKDGTVSWQGPVEIAADWKDFIFVFPRMAGTWTPPVIH